MGRDTHHEAQRLACALTGIAAVAAGLVVYAMLRPARIPLVPAALHFGAGQASPQSVIGSFPSAIHAFAMPLLTLACLREIRRVHAIAACLAWLVIDIAFELAQRNATSGFPPGTFDPLDLLGALVGAATAGAFALAVVRSKS